MKHLSLKWQLTLLYTAVMTLVVCCILALLFSFTNRNIFTSIQSQLEKSVTDALEDISFTNGALEIHSGFLKQRHDISLSLYASDGTFLYGKVPYGFDNSVAFVDGRVRRIQGTDVEYYVLDHICEIPGYGVADIRGVTAVSPIEQSILRTVRLAFILLPMLVVLTALLCYSLTRRTLRPVAQITDTVQAICQDKDLSRRIGLSGGNDEIYRLAATFDEMLQKIDESMKREQSFISDAAHELRTPLSAMTLQCEDLLSSPSLEEDTREGLLILQRKIRSLSRLISQLLTLSRMDQDRITLSYEKINLSELAQIAADEAAEIAAGRQILVYTDIDPDLYIHGDETLLIRFFMNLLSNAVSYGRTGGHIWLSLHQKDNVLTGTVRDDGIGIDPQDLPHIWKRFYRADKSRSDTENMGLGLSMADWIARKHGGSVWAESVPGEGSTFSFSFHS